jgi:hypothetical protein
MESQKQLYKLYRIMMWLPSTCYALITFTFMILPRSLFELEYVRSVAVFSRKLPFNFDWDYGSIFHYGQSLAAKFVLFKLTLLVVFVSVNFLLYLVLWSKIRHFRYGPLRYDSEDYRLIYFLCGALIITFCFNFVVPEWTQVLRHGNESIFILSLCLCILAHISLITLYFVLLAGASRFRNLFAIGREH